MFVLSFGLTAGFVRCIYGVCPLLFMSFYVVFHRQTSHISSRVCMLFSTGVYVVVLLFFKRCLCRCMQFFHRYRRFVSRQGSVCSQRCEPRRSIVLLCIVSSFGCVQKVCTRNVTSLRRPSSCNTVVTNVEVQDTDFLDTPIFL